MNPEARDTVITWRCKVVFRSIALFLGAVQVFLDRNGFGPDSQSYAEIARAYLRHDWAMAINAHWSPLYSWLIALTLQLGKPSLRGEFPLLHLLNFFIFIVTIAAFEFFWGGLLADERLNSEHICRVSLYARVALDDLGIAPCGRPVSAGSGIANHIEVDCHFYGRCDDGLNRLWSVWTE
jgi:hypothetical protein